MSAAMLDLETLSTRPHAVILSLGAVIFDPHTLSQPTAWLSIKFDVDEQIAGGRDIQEDTLAWWSQQSPQVIELSMDEKDRESVTSALERFTKFVLHADEIWSQGPVFDIVMLENLYNQYQMHVPWPYWKIRDSRTLFKALNHDPRQELRGAEASHHDALDDAVIQALAVQQCFQLLKEKSISPNK